MVIATIPALFALAGALIFALSTHAKASELGRVMFFAGLLAALLAAHGASVHVP